MVMQLIVTHSRSAVQARPCHTVSGYSRPMVVRVKGSAVAVLFALHDLDLRSEWNIGYVSTPAPFPERRCRAALTSTGDSVLGRSRGRCCRSVATGVRWGSRRNGNGSSCR
jgi:hypothetical protein